MTRRPIIGISLDYEPVRDPSYSPWYALRENYCSAISHHGALPIPIPHENNLINDYINHIDGLILTGGGYDIPPDYYGSLRHHESLKTNPHRTEFEMKMARAMLKTQKPILGICGGMELLTVIFGGTLIQDIPSEVENALNHQQAPPYDLACHDVTIKSGTLLHRIVKKTTIQVNSNHHQATRDIPEDIIVNALAPDGIIEGIEHPSHPFCLGILWHPEYYASIADEMIFKAFVRAAS